MSDLGWKPMLLYARYRLAMRLGWLRHRSPKGRWGPDTLANALHRGIPADPQAYAAYRKDRGDAPRFLFCKDDRTAAALRSAIGSREADLLDEADGIRRGEFRLFGGAAQKLGFPPRWNAFAGAPEAGVLETEDMARHWSGLRAEAFPADVKFLWEASRFAWLYPLARAYALTGRAEYAQAAWALIESWREDNAPNTGPHWMSAQEGALRILALTFGLHALEPWISEDPRRVTGVAELVAVHAARIPGTLTYSRSLGNNHLVSEAVGLYTAGLMFPEFRGSARWRRVGRRLLIDALMRQIYPDGGHLQHSLNYQRMVIEAGVWGAALADCNGAPFPEDVQAALLRGAGMLEALMEPETGRAPNLGANDGGRMFQLATTEFGDYRPTFQLAAHVCGGSRLPSGPWDEPCVWFGSAGRTAGRAASTVREQDFPYAGLHLSRAGRTRGMLRCARFTSRPSHSDQLHLDLWWRSQAVARDPGSYLYNALPPWDNSLALAAVHNTLVVGGEDPMERAGPFLWVDWAHGRWLGRWTTPDNVLEVLAGEHAGYRRIGLTHRRTVARAGEEVWLVVDDVLGEGEHTVRVVWQTPDCPSPRLQGSTFSMPLGGGYVVVDIEAPGDLFEGPSTRLGVYRQGELVLGEGVVDKPTTLGWYSPTYAHKDPSLTLVGEVSGVAPLRVVSWWSFGQESRDAVVVDWLVPAAATPAFSGLAYAGRRIELQAAPWPGEVPDGS